VLTCLLALLMVSNIRYYSFKDFNFRRRRPFSVLVALVLILVLLLGAAGAANRSHYSMGPAHYFTPECGDEANLISFANGIAYVEAAVKRGLAVDEFAPRVSFFFNAHNNLFEEIAKFRAARRLWAKIMNERFKAKDPRSMMLRFHTQTAGATLTARQPEVQQDEVRPRAGCGIGEGPPAE
jgi:hypothetical protein